MKTFKQYNEEADKKDSITFDIPLLIRVLELAREDVKDDMELHRIVERLIDIRNKGMLTMDDYSFIAKLKEDCEINGIELDESKPYTHNLVFTDKDDKLVNSSSISVKKDKHVKKKVKERMKLLKNMFGKSAGVKLSGVEKYVNESGRCWIGYKPKAGKKAYSKGSCVKEGHVEELESGLKQLDSHDYDTIHNLMMKISKDNNMSAKTLHDDFKNKHGKIPDDWIKEKYQKEDGMGAGAVGGSAGPTNVVGSGAIAGTGGKGGEPGVDMKKKKRNPIIMGMQSRK
jgi:hypothetical protein